MPPTSTTVDHDSRDGLLEVSTDQVRPSERVDYWRQLICERFGPLDLGARQDPSEHFSATLRGIQLGTLRLSRIAASAHHVGRPGSTVAVRKAHSSSFNFEIPLKGTAVFRQDGREATVSPGEFAVFRNDRPYWHGFRSAFDKLVIQVPRSMALAVEPRFDAYTAIRAGAELPLSSMTGHLFPHLADLGSWCESSQAARFASSFVELLMAALCEGSGERGPGTPQAKYLADARTYLSQHLYESDLSPAAAARAAGISVRYLHALFQREGTSVSRWVAERRLDRAHRLLSDGQQGWTITQVAHAVGFRDSAHFSRTFKATYGRSPRALRTEARRRGAARS